jgi:hypothetical protein
MRPEKLVREYKDNCSHGFTKNKELCCLFLLTVKITSSYVVSGHSAATKLVVELFGESFGLFEFRS